MSAWIITRIQSFLLTTSLTSLLSRSTNPTLRKKCPRPATTVMLRRCYKCDRFDAFRFHGKMFIVYRKCLQTAIVVFHVKGVMKPKYKFGWLESLLCPGNVDDNFIDNFEQITDILKTTCSTVEVVNFTELPAVVNTRPFSRGSTVKGNACNCFWNETTQERILRANSKLILRKLRACVFIRSV